MDVADLRQQSRKQVHVWKMYARVHFFLNVWVGGGGEFYMCNMLNQDDSGNLLVYNINLIGGFFSPWNTTNPTVAFFPTSQCVVFNCIYSLLSTFLRVRQSIEIKEVNFCNRTQWCERGGTKHAHVKLWTRARVTGTGNVYISDIGKIHTKVTC